MVQYIVIGGEFSEVAPTLYAAIQTVFGESGGFLTALTDSPAPYPRMRAGAKGGPDRYDALPPLARAGVLEAWHTNFDGVFFRCVRARLQASSDEGEHHAAPAARCRLEWDPQDIRIDAQTEWQALLDIATGVWPVKPEDIHLPGDDPYEHPPVRLVRRHVYTRLATLDAATQTVLTSGFAPGFVRYERMVDKHAGGDLVRYRIKGDVQGGGDWGELWLRAGGPEWTEVTVAILKMRLTILPQELQRVGTLPVEMRPAAIDRLAARNRAEFEGIAERKALLMREIWEHACRSLPPPWLSPERPDAAEALARAAGASAARDRHVVELWQQGLTAGEIGRELGVSANHVLNEVSRLRKALGEEQVPRRR